ncbi:hypothetical protein HAX54_008419 [Datura stramonium]|uniref:RRM domain-containing protein n=1 Tax=Datura stramonium TaxID=4076 RepID=A0ABS8RVM7_DATST|nr:hypothetical protein [Datura stramonium]
MAFFNKAGNILRQAISKQHINHEISVSKPSIFQLIRCMSSSKLFVGGISWNTNDNTLQEAFSKYGEVVEARVIYDRESGRSRGFGFVTFNSAEDASAAIQALDQQELDGGGDANVASNYGSGENSFGFGTSGGNNFASGDSYASGGNTDSVSNTFTSSFGDSDQLGNVETSNHAETCDVNSPVDAGEDYRDDNGESSDYADRRA